MPIDTSKSFDLDNQEVFVFTLSNSLGTTVKITNYGATIMSFVVKKDDRELDIVLGFDDPKDYTDPSYTAECPYFGAAIGRYGNRIGDASFVIDGVTYEIEKNLGTDNLHGGKKGFDKQVWQLVRFEESPHPTLTLRHVSEDGDGGFPGTLTTELRFTLNEMDELIYSYSATTDKPTPFNPTHHSYFNLDGSERIDAHMVRISGEQVLEQDQKNTPTGLLLPVAGTAYDFREARRIDANWQPNKGFDTSFVTGNHETDVAVATAWSTISGIRLDLFTTEPIVHLYTANGMKAKLGKYGPCAGFCLETQVHPNAINIPSFPNTVLRPGEEFQSTTIYRISHLPSK